jgi:DNA-binding transcriptional ArsR family regulator
MQDVVEAAKEYVLECLGLQINPVSWKSNGNFPIFLVEYYTFYSAVILDKSYLLAVTEEEDLSPAQIAKHLEHIEKLAGVPVIYVSEKLPGYNRQRLVAHRGRFVIPGVQLYLPDLGIDCRKAASEQISPSQELRPSAQMVVISALIEGFDHITPSKLASSLGYTRMTMTRALNELEKKHLGKTFRKGKERYFSFYKNKKALWEQAIHFMHSPVKEFFWIQVSNETFEKIRGLGFVAGLTALSEQSMLNPPREQIFALSQERWKALVQSGNIRILPISEGANIQVEIWHYDPGLFAKGRIVNPFSLYLSLQKTNDERVEQALDHLMEKIEW